MPRERISACLIAQDEQEHLATTLDSVAFCEEKIVVDGGSRDGTVQIARAAGARVIENPWPGFAAQRNVALDAARCDWILEIDADERVSPRLRASTERLLDGGAEASMAVCPLRHSFLGRPLGPSGKYPAYRSRIFKRGAYRHDETRMVHEGVEPHERPIVLEGDLEHELAGTLREALLDAWRYAWLEGAHIRPSRNPLAYLEGIVARPLAKLFYRTVVDGGWRDGWRGLLKILLDASSDALVWILVLVRASPSSAASIERSDGTAEGRHFGRRPTGVPKVVAIAGRGEATQVARRWLDALRSAGVDVALLSDDERTSEEIPTQKLRHLRPLETMRALDIEMQIRTIHAVVAFGPLASFVRQVIPASLRPEIRGLDIHADPVLTGERLHATADW